MQDYDYSDLKGVASDSDHKAALLDLLLEFDKFCEEHGLTYYLSGGTLLGAVRHKGFIPWDDDVDVNMPRPDCEKLMELSGGKIGDFELMPPNSSAKYFAYHWKLYSNAMLIAKRAKSGVGKKVYPIFLDIFPIEGLPDTEEGNLEHFAEIKRRKNRVRHARGVSAYRGNSPYRKLRNKVARRLYSPHNLEPLFEEVNNLATSIPFDEAEYVGVMATNVHAAEERVVKAEYTPVVRMEFEGHMLACPEGYDAYLTQLYGPDYMLLLPVHRRVPRHDFVTFFPYGPGEKPQLYGEEAGDSTATEDSQAVTDDQEMLEELA